MRCPDYKFSDASGKKEDSRAQTTLQEVIIVAFSVCFNAENLTHTALKFTEGPGANRLIQREFYGVTLHIDADYHF